MQIIHVRLAERSYPILIGTDTLPCLASELVKLIPSWSHAIVICDARLASTYAESVTQALKESGKRVSVLTVPSGEGSKSTEQLAKLWAQMLTEKADRKSVVIALGGGVIGDLAGFAAASFMRGLRLIQIPTTLLAMVDSSVGGKTGINLPEAKNMVGAFWQPHSVWIDTHFLQSLPEREYVSGLAEVVKYGVILDQDFFAFLESNSEKILNRDSDCIETIVRRSCELKARVVSEDERETTGLRAVLNYGHTFGHAIEATTSYGRFLHGEAISIGMMMAGRLANKLKLWPSHCVIRQGELLQKLGLPIQYTGCEPTALIEAMQMDKKTEYGKLHFILPTKIGHVQSVSGCDPADVAASIESD